MVPISFSDSSNYDFFSTTSFNDPIKIRVGNDIFSSKSSAGIFYGLTHMATTTPDKYQFHKMIDKDPRDPNLKAEALQNPLWNEDVKWNPTSSKEDTVAEHLMYEIILMKATQNPEILKALLNTGDSSLVADIGDRFWGIGKDGKGRNALGKAWERAREGFREELQNTGQIRVRQGVSPELAGRLNLPYTAGYEYAQSLSREKINALPDITKSSEIKNHILPEQQAVRPSGAKQISVPPSTTTNPQSVSSDDISTAYGKALHGFQQIDPNIQSFSVEPNRRIPGSYMFRLQFASGASHDNIKIKLSANDRWRSEGKDFLIEESKAQEALSQVYPKQYEIDPNKKIVEMVISNDIREKTINLYKQSYPMGSPHHELTTEINEKILKSGEKIIQLRMDPAPTGGIRLTAICPTIESAQEFFHFVDKNPSIPSNDSGAALAFLPCAVENQTLEKLLIKLGKNPKEWIPKLFQEQKLYNENPTLVQVPSSTKIVGVQPQYSNTAGVQQQDNLTNTGVLQTQYPTTPQYPTTGMPQHNPMGMPQHNPMGMPQHNPMGMPQHNPMGMPQHNPMGMPQHNPMGMPQHNPMGMPQHNPMGMPQHNPMGMPQQHNPMGMPQHNPMGMPQQHNPMGMPQPQYPTMPQYPTTGVQPQSNMNAKAIVGLVKQLGTPVSQGPGTTTAWMPRAQLTNNAGQGQSSTTQTNKQSGWNRE